LFFYGYTIKGNKTKLDYFLDMGSFEIILPWELELDNALHHFRKTHWDIKNKQGEYKALKLLKKKICTCLENLRKNDFIKNPEKAISEDDYNLVNIGTVVKEEEEVF
jgi:hypothetical protein